MVCHPVQWYFRWWRVWYCELCLVLTKQYHLFMPTCCGWFQLNDIPTCSHSLSLLPWYTSERAAPSPTSYSVCSASIVSHHVHSYRHKIQWHRRRFHREEIEIPSMISMMHPTFHENNYWGFKSVFHIGLLSTYFISVMFWRAPAR